MGIRFAVTATLISILCLFSEPLYEMISWKGSVPEAIRQSTTLIPLGQDVVDTLGGAQQYHAVRVPANRMLRINVSSSEFDPVAILYHATTDSLTMLESDDDDGEGTDARIERCVALEGPYVVKVTAFGRTNVVGRYEIKVEAEEADCEGILRAEREREREAQQLRDQEEARRREQARSLYQQGRSITMGQSVSGSLGGGSTLTPDGKPFESWELTCGAGESFQLDVEGHGYDAYARIVNREGAEVASNDDGGGNLNARILYTCPSAGSYFLVSTSYSTSANGRYTLRVSRR